MRHTYDAPPAGHLELGDRTRAWADPKTGEWTIVRKTDGMDTDTIILQQDEAAKLAQAIAEQAGNEDGERTPCGTGPLSEAWQRGFNDAYGAILHTINQSIRDRTRPTNPYGHKELDN